MPNQPTPNVLIAIISSFLESHKRLVVHQLSAFIVKEPGQVLFTELLKRDDGVLRGELRTAGLNELEAAGEIDNFVFEVRHAVSRGEGVPRRGARHTETRPQRHDRLRLQPPSEPARRRGDRIGTHGTGTAGRSAGEARGRGRTRTAAHRGIPGAKRLRRRNAGRKGARRTADSGRTGHLALGEDAPRSVGARPPLRPSAEEHRRLHLCRPPAAPPRRPDRFIWIAVLAIALAAAAIAFGLWREAQQAQEEEPAVRYETTLPVPHAGDDATQPADDAAAPDTPAAGTTQTPEEQ